ncbi:MAG TPA: MerR family transcriptional regulator [Candidatus Nitrosotalea sp.]|nr:MerR family transcriptional regulator [Candidatus Nitrosotalea sp.]
MVAYSIGAVARQTGLSTDTIRAWERRYGLVRPLRGAGGIRSYREAEVTRLVLARRATELGHPIRNVAALDDKAIAALVKAKPATSPDTNDELPREAVVAAMLDALLNDDPARLRRTITAAATLMDSKDLALSVLVPLLAQVGRLWERGMLSIWQEHLLSELVATTIRSIESFAKDGGLDAGMLLATPPRELHAFGTAFAAMIASTHGFRIHNLGVSVPVAELVAAAKRLQVRYVAIGITCTNRRSAELAEYLRDLDRKLPRAIAVWIGGHASAEIVERAGTRRLRAIGTLEEFDRALERQPAPRD